MKKCFLSIVISTLILDCIAGIGHITVSFEDASRNNREVTAEVYYPSTGNGEMTGWEPGSFAMVVFGHGFLMDYDAYQNIWEALVPEGYVMVFCTNETGLTPNHEDFGLDLRFLANSLMSENVDEFSFFYTHLTGKNAVSGHSMGGGASVLAAADNDVFDAYIGLAPAETNPSAVGAGAGVNVPSMILSGSADAITPPDQHHIPIYDALASPCKLFVNLIEGSHCYFANTGSLCDFGEVFPGELSQATQQEITHTLMLFWLDKWLKNEDVYDALIDYTESNTDLSYNSDCATSVGENHSEKIYSIWPNPASTEITIDYIPKGDEKIYLGQNGQLVELPIKNKSSEFIRLDTRNLAPGVYFLQCIGSVNHHFIGRVIIQ